MTAILTAVLAPRAAVTVQLANKTVADVRNGIANAGYKLSSDGRILNAQGAPIDSWMIGGGSASTYEAYATLVSGTLSSGTTDVWQSCSGSPSWGVANDARNNSTKTAVIGVQIRAVASPAAILASATITLEAESDNNN